MDKLLNEHVNYCYESVKKALVLRGIINSPSQDEIITLNTRYIPLHSSDVLDVLYELSQDPPLAQKIILADGSIVIKNHTIEILDHQQLSIAIPLGAELHGLNERYEYIIDMKAKADIRKLYSDELKKLELSTAHNGKLMEFNKQIATVKKLLEEKKVKLSKRTFDFSFDDLPDAIAKNINLNLALLWIEKDLEYPLKIENGFIPVTRIGTDDDQESIVFSLSLGKLVFRGDDYCIDLNDCLVKFDNEKVSYPFEVNSKAYLLFKIFIVEGVKSISPQELIQRLESKKIPESGEGNYISKLLYDIRNDILETKAKGTRNIIIKTKEKNITLRGL